MKKHWKIGIHGSGNGTYTHYGTYRDTLRAHGIPRVVQAVDNAGLIYEMQRDPVPGDVLVFRFAKHNGVDMDRIPEDGMTGTYVGDPTQESIKRQQAIAQIWPPELDRSKVWYIDINEPSKETWNYEYLGKWALAGARWALENGANYLAWGWSSGTPEPSFWESPSVLEYLRLAAEYPDRVGVSLHCYTLEPAGSMMDFYPHLIGRFEALNDTCDRHGIARPTIVIGEFGWGENSIEWSAEDAMLQFDWAQELYDENVLGCCLWTLGKWHGDIVSDVIGLMEALIDRAVNYEGEEMADCFGKARAQYRRVVHVAMTDYTTKEQRVEIYATAMQAGESVGPSADDGGIGDLNDKTVILWQIPTAKQAEFTGWYAQHYPGTKVQFAYLGQPPQPPTGNAGFSSPVDPQVYGTWPDGWVDAAPFGVYYQYTGGTAYHTGADLNKNEPYWDADKLAPVYASEGGTVVFSGVGSGTWGNMIVVKSPHVGFGHIYHRYAHMQERLVQAGETVVRGQNLGRIGNASGQLAYHLHFDTAVTNILETNPGHWPGTNLSAVVQNYVDPKHLILLSGPGYTWPAKRNAWISSNVNFRCGPTTQYTVIRIIQQGTAVEWLNTYGEFHLIKAGTEYGWVHQDFLSYSPPSSGGTPTGIGLHASANDGMGLFSDIVIAEFGKLKPQVVKFLSFHDPALISSIVANNKNTIDTYIVRAFLSWQGVVTPQQFYERTLPDVQRSVNAILGQGIDPAKICIELHNEMNLAQEGMWLSWSSGQSCSNFFVDVLGKYRSAIPNVRYGIGGLSPGGDQPGVRAESKAFAQGMISHGIMNMVDVNFIHAYTESNWEGPYEMSWVQWNLDAIRKPTWITESSWHTPVGSDGQRTIVPGNEYAAKLAELIGKLDQTPVNGVTFFCASASSQAFRHESFVISANATKPYESGQSRGIAASLRERIPYA